MPWGLPVGLALFGVGLLGNFYHHYLLATLRSPGETKYKVPRGGCFEYVAAPHYFFELLRFGLLTRNRTPTLTLTLRP